MVINRNGKQPKCKLHFGAKIVKQTNEYCYLGVVITACGSFSSAMKMLYKKGLKAMFCLLNNVNKTKQPPVKILSDLFDKMISPVILYNCEIWGASLLKKEELQLAKPCRKFVPLTVPARRSAHKIHENRPGCKF